MSFVRTIPTLDGHARVEAGRNGVTLTLYGRQGGYLAGASFAIGNAPVLAAGLREAENRVLDGLVLEPTEDELTAVPWLGSG